MDSDTAIKKPKCSQCNGDMEIIGCKGGKQIWGCVPCVKKDIEAIWAEGESE